MKLKAINKNTEKYGYKESMEYINPEFNGHQVGVAICIKNNITGEIESNYLSERLGDEETRNFLLGELLHEEKALFIKKRYDEIKTVYYMPYFIEDHSRFISTVTYKDIAEACRTQYKALVEVIFVEDTLCRYMTIPITANRVGIFESVYDIFDDEDALSEIGIKWQEETEESPKGYALDFYNEAGVKYVLTFRHTMDFRDRIASMRVIKLEYDINREEDNENTTQ